MKQGWTEVQLGDISQIVNGGTPDTTERSFWHGKVLWITPKDMGKLQSIYVDETSRKITESGLQNSSAKILPENSIILSSRAPIGYLAINKKPITTNQGCKGIIPSKRIISLYLYYFLFHSVDLLNNLGSGTTFKELSSSKLSLVNIPLPPLPEQQRIVAILDQAFDAIARAKANTEKNLANARELFESISYNLLFTSNIKYEKSKLEEICYIVNGSTPLRSNKTFWENGDIPWFTIDDIRKQGRIIKDTIQKITKAALAKSSNRLLPPQSILLCCTASIGEYAITEIPLTTNQQFNGLVIKDKNRINPNYLFHYSATLKDQLLKLSGKTTIDFVPISRLKDIEIPVPPILFQLAIVSKLDALSAETQKLEALTRQERTVA